MKIHAYRDGNDLVVIFKDASPDLEALISRLPDFIMGPDADLEAAAEVAPEIRINYGPYRNAEISEILATEGDNGYGNVSYLVKMNKVSENRTEIIEALLQYRAERFAQIADPVEYATTLPEDALKKMVKIFGEDLPEEKKAAVISQAGFTSYEAFLEHAEERQLRSLLASVILYFK